jgi:hypothetical protein
VLCLLIRAASVSVSPVACAIRLENTSHFGATEPAALQHGAEEQAIGDPEVGSRHDP